MVAQVQQISIGINLLSSCDFWVWKAIRVVIMSSNTYQQMLPKIQAHFFLSIFDILLTAQWIFEGPDTDKI